MTKGATNKRKGSNAEREFASAFREMGFTYCKTSREGSKMHDGAGIDLLFVPMNIQIKAGKQKGLNASKEIRYVHDRVRETFPEGSIEYFLPKILIHKKEVGQGKKRTQFDTIVSMTFEDFKLLISKIKKWD